MKSLLTGIALLLCIGLAGATTVDARIVQVTNNGAIYAVKVQLKVNVAAGLGGATLAFTFNTASLSYPATPAAGTDYSFAAYSGGNYSTATVTRPQPNKVSVNIEFNGNPGQATNVGTTFTDVVTVTFTTIQTQGNSNLVWVTEQAIADDGMTQWTNGTYTGLNDSPLPIQLVSFNVNILSSDGVQLLWSTASEINNYGFYVQRSADAKTFTTLPGSFQPGHGTTIEHHDYSYTDATAGDVQYFYRLEQVDRDGTITYSESKEAGGTTGVKEQKPTEFALQQNYPNPFNPTSVIEYSLPSSSHVLLELYNLLGQKIATLVNDVKAPGFYQVQVDGAHLASGVYIYRLTAGQKTFVRKMALVK